MSYHMRCLYLLVANRAINFDFAGTADILGSREASQIAAAMLAKPGQLSELLLQERPAARESSTAMRFMFAEAANLRVGEIAELQSAYRELLLLYFAGPKWRILFD